MSPLTFQPMFLSRCRDNVIQFMVLNQFCSWQVVPVFNDCNLVLVRVYTDFPSLTAFYWVLLGFTGFYWVLLGFKGFH